MYENGQGHLTLFCIVFVWLRGRPSTVRSPIQDPWFMYQNRLGPSGGIYYPNFVPCFVVLYLNYRIGSFSLDPRTTDTQWRHKSKISEKLGRCGRQNMLPPYLKIWEWEWIFGRAVKAISSLGVRSPCYNQIRWSKKSDKEIGILLSGNAD